MSFETNKRPKFSQLNDFAYELLLLLVDGEKEDVEIICNEIEQGTIINYFYEKYGFKDINNINNINNLVDVNNIMKMKYVSNRNAENQGLSKNGIVYLIELILHDLVSTLYNLKSNGINPDDYRND